jgi:DNA-binding transcriptional regulator YhcF (GntR family)
MSEKPTWTATDILREQIKTYLIENPIQRGQPGCYLAVAEMFSVNTEYIRDIYKRLRKKGLVPDSYNGKDSTTSSDDQGYETSFKEDVTKGEADVTFITRKRIKTLADLVEACEVDLTEWDILTYEVNKWEVGRKDKSVKWTAVNGVASGEINDTGKIHVEPLFQVKAKIGRKKVAKDMTLQKEAILAELRSYKPAENFLEKFLAFQKVRDANSSQIKDCLYEISLFDHHFGKLSWSPDR